MTTAGKKIASGAQDVSGLGFEAALGELEQIVRKLEAGADDLEGSIAAYERGVALRRHCEEKLKDATAKIERIAVSQDGAVTLAPFQDE